MNVSLLARDIAHVAKWRPVDPVVTWRRIDDRAVRYTTTLDDESEDFERELLMQSIVPCHEGIGHGGTLTSERGKVELPLQQRHAWLRHTDQELRLLQVRDPSGRPAMQAVVHVYRPRYLPWLGHGVVHRLGHATNGVEEHWGLRMLRALCAEGGELITLRLQPRRLGVHALCDVESRARRAGFRLTDPDGITRTLLLNLCESSDALMTTVSAGTRRKVRSLGRSGFVLRPLLDTRAVDACLAAALAAARRHGRHDTRTPVAPILALAPTEPTRVRALGLFHRDRPDALLAFAAAQRDGEIAEYLAAGSIDDPELRKHPFNYWLLWELASWARANGARHLDLGGISEGGPDDPLVGIASFKRHFTQNEVEVGRELVAVLHPAVEVVSRALRRIARD